MLLSPLQAEVRDYDSAESYLSDEQVALDCLIADVELPGMSGMELLRLLRARGNCSPVILLGGEEDIRAAVLAMREGATDFIERVNVRVAVVHSVVSQLSGTLKRVAH